MADAAEFIRVALDRWRAADTFETSQRKEAALDLRFLNLQQWDDQDAREREASGKQALVIDQIGEPYRQLTGQQRQARPGIQVNPVDSGADIDTAEVMQQLFRHVELTGHAKQARDQAFKGAAGPGWGYYRILLEWEYDHVDPTAPNGPELFDQCIKYQAIEDPFTVYRDPACPLYEPWAARYCFVTEDIPKEEFTRRWPDKIATSADAFNITGVSRPEWFPETAVKVADYYYVEYEELPAVALLPDGTVVPKAQVPPGVTPLTDRPMSRRVVKQAKITGAQILEGDENRTAGRLWPGRYIPVVLMPGESLVVDGKRILRGVVRPTRDLLRAYNYEVSELLYELACSPKSKVMMPGGAQIGYEKQWQEAPAKAFPYLLYNPTVTTVDGRTLQTPQPQVAHFTDATKIQALVVAITQLKSDLRTVTGWYDPTDPSRRNSDQSGRAILARKEAQNEGAVNYKENFGNAVLFEAMILLDLIPKVYQRPGRILRLLGEEGESLDALTVGGPWKKPHTKIDGIFEWGLGRYDVAVSIGASYLTRRQESTDQGLELMKILDPMQRAVITPAIVSNMDIPGSRALARKMTRTLPPELREDAESPPELPPQVQQRLQQAEQVIAALTQELQGKNDLIEKETLKRRSDEDIARLHAEVETLKVRADLIKAFAEIDADAGKAQLAEETRRLLQLADLETQTRLPGTPPVSTSVS